MNRTQSVGFLFFFWGLFAVSFADSVWMKLLALGCVLSGSYLFIYGAEK